MGPCFRRDDDNWLLRRRPSYQQLRPILRRERLGSLDALGLLGWAEPWRRRGSAVDGVADRHEEFLLARRRAHAEQACRLVRFVLERMRRVGGDVQGRAGARLKRLAPESQFDLALQDGEHLLKIVTVRRQDAARWEPHGAQTVA